MWQDVQTKPLKPTHSVLHLQNRITNPNLTTYNMMPTKIV